MNLAGLAAAEIAHRMKQLTNQLVAQGCQICGDPAELTSLAPPKVTMLLDSSTRDVRVRTDQNVQVRCRLHSPFLEGS